MWDAIARETLAGAHRALARAGLHRSELEYLAEEVAQETLLELCASHEGPGRPDRRTRQRALWRCSARVLRARRTAPSPLQDRHLDGAHLPPREVAAREAEALLQRQLGAKERELLQLLRQEGRQEERIHRTALAHELGVSRRTVGRRLDLLGRLIRHTRSRAAIE